MSEGKTPRAEAIVARLRRLVTIWRATYILQMILLLLLVLAVGLEAMLPGVLSMLMRSDLGAQLLPPVILVPLLGLDPVAATVEQRMGRLLGAERTPVRRVLRFGYLVPSVMLLRRSLLLALALIWLSIIICALVAWFVGLILGAVFMKLFEPVGRAFGRAVDAVDIFLNWVYWILRDAVRQLALSPAKRIEDEEHIVLPLLAAKVDPNP